MTEGDVTLIPWLVGDEWKKSPKIKSKYIFGHCQHTNYYMNHDRKQNRYYRIICNHKGNMQTYRKYSKI